MNAELLMMGVGSALQEGKTVWHHQAWLEGNASSSGKEDVPLLVQPCWGV